MKKIKIIDEFHYQEYPITEDMVEIDEKDLINIGVNKKFNITNSQIVDYDNSSVEIKKKQEIRKLEIIKRLKELSNDIIQMQMGEIVPNIKERKKEFICLHNELRNLLGKSKRQESYI